MPRGRVARRLAPLGASQLELVERNVRYADALVAGFLRTRGAAEYMRADMIGAAYEALVRSAACFEPSRGMKFTSFAHHRITGAIVDTLRAERAGRPKDRAAGPTVPLDESWSRAASSLRVDEACAARQTLLRLVALPGQRGRLMTAMLEGRDMATAARAIGITKSWASRLRDSIEREVAA